MTIRAVEAAVNMVNMVNMNAPETTMVQTQRTGPRLGTAPRPTMPPGPPAPDPKALPRPAAAPSPARAVATPQSAVIPPLSDTPPAADQDGPPPEKGEAVLHEPIPLRSEIHEELEAESHLLNIENFSLYYGKRQAVYNISMKIPAGKVTALIGPSGCGKSTMLRSMNRLNDLVKGVRVEGNIRYRGQAIYNSGIDVIELRKRLGMVFQKSNPFPMSVYENVVYALRIAGVRRRSELDSVCERSLRGAALWDEVKDRLKASAVGLSGGQQQRLCIARAIAADPEVLLMDEPCSALDPIATNRIEELIYTLRGKYTVVIVTHNMQQAGRVSDYTAFLYLGHLIEYGPTTSLFQNPRLKQTEDYITGRFG